MGYDIVFLILSKCLLNGLKIGRGMNERFGERCEWMDELCLVNIL